MWHRMPSSCTHVATVGVKGSMLVSDVVLVMVTVIWCRNVVCTCMSSIVRISQSLSTLSQSTSTTLRYILTLLKLSLKVYLIVASVLQTLHNKTLLQ